MIDQRCSWNERHRFVPPYYTQAGDRGASRSIQQTKSSQRFDPAQAHSHRRSGSVDHDGRANPALRFEKQIHPKDGNKLMFQYQASPNPASGLYVLKTPVQHRRPFPLRNSSSARRGVAAAEAGLVLPVILTLLLGTWEMGRYVEVQQILANACRVGGRMAASGQYTNSQVQQGILNYLQNASLPSTSATVTVADLTTPGLDATLANELDQLKVTVSIPFTAVRWATVTLVTNSSTQLTASSIWVSCNGQQYPSSLSVPPGY